MNAVMVHGSFQCLHYLHQIYLNETTPTITTCFFAVADPKKKLGHMEKILLYVDAVVT